MKNGINSSMVEDMPHKKVMVSLVVNAPAIIA